MYMVLTNVYIVVHCGMYMVLTNVYIVYVYSFDHCTHCGTLWYVYGFVQCIHCVCIWFWPTLHMGQLVPCRTPQQVRKEKAGGRIDEAGLDNGIGLRPYPPYFRRRWIMCMILKSSKPFCCLFSLFSLSLIFLQYSSHTNCVSLRKINIDALLPWGSTRGLLRTSCSVFYFDSFTTIAW